MIEIGSVIRGRVDRVCPHGLCFHHGDDRVVVLAPEVSWTAKGELSERVRIGDEYDVLVIHRNYQTGEFVGSIRRLQPEQNPYRALSRLPPGELLHAIIGSTAGNEVTVSFANGARGYFPKGLLNRQIHAGETIDVRIATLDVDEGRLTVIPGAAATIGNGHTQGTTHEISTSKPGA